MNRNRQLSNVYWRNAKPYLNLQSTQPSINSTNKWVSFKSNTGNFIFNGSLAGCSVQLQFEFLWGDELWPGFPRSYATSKWPIEAIASLKQVSVKRGLRSANSRLSVKSLQSSFYILHSVCILPLVRTLRFTLTISQTFPECNWTHTNPVYLTFTWKNRKFQLKKIKWFASIRSRSFIKKDVWTEAMQFFYSF